MFILWWCLLKMQGKLDCKGFSLVIEGAVVYASSHWSLEAFWAARESLGIPTHHTCNSLTAFPSSVAHRSNGNVRVCTGPWEMYWCREDHPAAGKNGFRLTLYCCGRWFGSKIFCVYLPACKEEAAPLFAAVIWDWGKLRSLSKRPRQTLFPATDHRC